MWDYITRPYVRVFLGMNWNELAIINGSVDADRNLSFVITGNLWSLNKYYLRGKGSDYKIVLGGS